MPVNTGMRLAVDAVVEDAGQILLIEYEIDKTESKGAYK